MLDVLLHFAIRQVQRSGMPREAEALQESLLRPGACIGRSSKALDDRAEGAPGDLSIQQDKLIGEIGWPVAEIHRSRVGRGADVRNDERADPLMMD